MNMTTFLIFWCSGLTLAVLGIIFEERLIAFEKKAFKALMKHRAFRVMVFLPGAVKDALREAHEDGKLERAARRHRRAEIKAFLKATKGGAVREN